MKIDVGEGNRAAGAPTEENHNNPTHGYGGSSSSHSAPARSDALLPDSNRAVVEQQAAFSPGLTAGERSGEVHGAAGPSFAGVATSRGGGEGGSNLVAVSVQHGSRNNNTREVDRIVGRDEFSQVILFFVLFGRAFFGSSFCVLVVRWRVGVPPP